MKLYTYCQNTKLCEHVTRWLISCTHSQQENNSSSPSDGRLLDILDSLRQEDEVYDQHVEPTSSVVSLIHSEESPSSDYCLKLKEGDTQSDYQVQNDKGNTIKLQDRAENSGYTCTLIRSTGNNTKKKLSSCHVSLDDSIRKPLLDESL